MARTLEAERDEILGRWLVAVAEQPFHHARPEQAVADEIPELFDALLGLLRRGAANGRSGPPVEDPTVLSTARRHAAARIAQGLTPTQIAFEFRVLRQEIWRALRSHLDPSIPTSDVLAAELIVNDCLDGVIQVALSKLGAWEEEHRRLTAEFAQQRAALAAIVESSEDAIISKSLEGTIRSWNRGAERLYGYAADEVIGQSISILIPPDRRDELVRILERLERGERVEPYETVRVRKDGVPVDVSVSVSPLRDENGAIVGASTIAHSIAERKTIERERGTFLAAVTHDLRNPPTAIRGMVHLIRRQLSRGDLPADALLARLQAIDNACLALEALLSGLQDVLHLREGERLFLHRERVDFSTIVQDVVVRYQAADADHVISFAAPDSELIGTWDAGRLERVVDNLIGNAVKFSPSGGPIRISLQRDDETAVLRVQDEGLGIPESDVPSIFEWFQRGRNVTGKVAGTGVGLAAVREIVQQHGGSIDVESREGEGSTFTVRLPLE